MIITKYHVSAKGFASKGPGPRALCRFIETNKMMHGIFMVRIAYKDKNISIELYLVIAPGTAI